MARIRAVLRRAQCGPAASRVIQAGELMINVDARRVEMRSQPVHHGVLVVKRVLRLDDTACALAHPAGKRMAYLVKLDIADTRPPRVHLVRLAKA